MDWGQLFWISASVILGIMLVLASGMMVIFAICLQAEEGKRSHEESETHVSDI